MEAPTCRERGFEGISMCMDRDIPIHVYAGIPSPTWGLSLVEGGPETYPRLGMFAAVVD